LNLNGLPAGSLLRVSTAEQAHNGTSLREQSETVRAYIERSGMTFVREYVEEDGISGRAEHRPDVEALVADVVAGVVKVVVVHRIDRGARDLRLLLNIIHRIESAGGLVLSATQFYDPTTPEGRLMRNMLGATAELDRDHIVKRLTDGVRRVAAEGHWPGGVPPFGLARRRTEADRHTRVVLDEDEAATARAAAALVVDDGLSAADAAARLNALGHRTRTGTRWGPKSLRRMLLADHLTGTYLWAAGSRSPSKSEPIAIPVPAVFSPERHAEVRLALGPEAATSPPKGRAVYLLSRRVASPCGKHYWGRPLGRDGSRRYLCADEASRCGCPRLDAERVESRVWQEVAALLIDRERLTTMAQHYLATQAERVGGRRHDVAGVEAKIAKLERALNETVVDYAREGVPAAVVRAATDTLAGELSQLRRHRADLLRWRSAEEASQRHRNHLWRLARRAGDRLDTMGDDERAALLAMLAVQVTVTGTSRCPQCDGRGRVGGRQGGYRCGRCRGMRTLVDLRIEGEVMDDLDYRLGADGRQGHLVDMPSAVSIRTLCTRDAGRVRRPRLSPRPRHWSGCGSPG
jgi:DNA invertase Pin-like site-specific DNA recombinase